MYHKLQGYTPYRHQTDSSPALFVTKKPTSSPIIPVRHQSYTCFVTIYNIVIRYTINHHYISKMDVAYSLLLVHHLLLLNVGYKHRGMSIGVASVT